MSDQKTQKNNKEKNAKCNIKNEKNDEKALKDEIKALKAELKEAKETAEDLTNNYIKQENLIKNLNITCVELKNDLERIRERNKNIVQEANDNAVINIAKDFMPILDNFEQALRVVKDKELLHGFELIYNQTKTMLRNLDIEEIETTGQMFNPEFHNAITKEPATSEEDSGKVATEFQKGYKFKDRIVRPSTVSVFE